LIKTKTSKQEKTVQKYKKTRKRKYLESEEMLISLYLFASPCDLQVLHSDEEKKLWALNAENFINS